MTWNRVIAGCALFVTIAASGLAAVPLRVPFFAQKKNGCGAASAAMVLHYWSGALPDRAAAGPAPEEVYRRLYRPDLNGIRLRDISQYLEAMGFRAFTFRGNWTDVEEQLGKGRPIIVGLKKGPTKDMHFVVVTGAEDASVWLNDPTKRKAGRVARDKFERQWSIADRWLLLAVPHGTE